MIYYEFYKFTLKANLETALQIETGRRQSPQPNGTRGRSKRAGGGWRTGTQAVQPTRADRLEAQVDRPASGLGMGRRREWPNGGRQPTQTCGPGAGGARPAQAGVVGRPS